MENQQLILCAFLLSLAGLALLAVSAQLSEPQQVRISELGDSHLGKFVSVSGTVSSPYFRNGSLFAKICSGPCVRVVVFKSSLPSLSTHGNNLYLLRNGDRLRVAGQLSSYNGEYEIEAEEAEING